MGCGVEELGSMHDRPYFCVAKEGYLVLSSSSFGSN
jgi:hypothetical protein